MNSYLLHRQNLKLNGKPEPVKKVYVIAKRSAKKIAEQKVYSPFVAEYLARPENQKCAINWENCTVTATCINHLKRRFKETVMNEKYIEPSCFNCNNQIEAEDERARAEGHLLTKFNLD
jgi:hypothetical protein